MKGATGQEVTSGAEILSISIHAPVKGATDSADAGGQHHRNFNPRTREGCDLGHLIKVCFPRNFNPRTREGCDQAMHTPFIPGYNISIHAPVKGATKQYRRLLRKRGISIHAPVKGATQVARRGF